MKNKLHKHENQSTYLTKKTENNLFKKNQFKH